jgi:plastocyanin
MRYTRSSIGSLILVAATAGAGAAQTTLERTPLNTGGWVGLPGQLEVNTSFRFARGVWPVDGISSVPTFEAALGLPARSLVGGRFVPHSPAQRRTSDEWEVYARHQPLTQYRGAPLDLSAQVGFNAAARSVDGELAAARWEGPLRLLVGGRFFSDAFGEGDARGALSGGVLFFPSPRNMPLALTLDVASELDRLTEEVAWSAGAQLGASFTTHTLSLFVTNTASGSVQGMSRGAGATRLGLELTLPIPFGRYVGWYPAREVSARAVSAAAPPLPGPTAPIQGTIFRYLFVEDRLEIPAGSVVEWTNHDDVVHTVSAADGTWQSGPIEPGETWRARFAEPGTFTYYCGPHPFMKGAVTVR